MTKDYSAPEFEEFGTVADLTETGNSQGGMFDSSVVGNSNDMKNGSVASSGV